MTITHDIQVTGDGELGTAFVEKILNKGVLGAPKDPKKVFERALRRAMAKTGMETFKQIKAHFRDDAYGLAPLRMHPKTGVNMALTYRRYRPYDLATVGKVAKIMRTPSPGGKLWRLMQWQLDEENGKWVKVGLIPSRRGGDKWAKIFENWQKAGKLDFTGYNQGANFFAMQRYSQKLGMPLTRWPQRPERDVIGRVDKTYKPSEQFERFFAERLLK